MNNYEKLNEEINKRLATDDTADIDLSEVLTLARRYGVSLHAVNLLIEAVSNQKTRRVNGTAGISEAEETLVQASVQLTNIRLGGKDNGEIIVDLKDGKESKTLNFAANKYGSEKAFIAAFLSQVGNKYEMSVVDKAALTGKFEIAKSNQQIEINNSVLKKILIGITLFAGIMVAIFYFLSSPSMDRPNSAFIENWKTEKHEKLDCLSEIIEPMDNGRKKENLQGSLADYRNTLQGLEDAIPSTQKIEYFDRTLKMFEDKLNKIYDLDITYCQF